MQEVYDDDEDIYKPQSEISLLFNSWLAIPVALKLLR